MSHPLRGHVSDVIAFIADENQSVQHVQTGIGNHALPPEVFYS